MKYLKIYILFAVTFIIALIIMFVNPNSKYLGIYKNTMTINYDFNDEEYVWVYDIDNEIFNIEEIDSEKWKYTPKKNGTAKVTYFYLNKNNPLDYKYKIVYDLMVKGKKIYWTDGLGYGLTEYPNPY